MATVSLREYGRLRGISGEAVRKAISSGRLTGSVRYDAKGRPSVDPVAADAEWSANTSHAQQAPMTVEPEQEDAPALPRGGNAASTYNQARAVKEAYLARLTKLDLDERSGLLVSVDSVKNEAFKAARQVRDTMINIPDRVSAELAAMTDQFEIHARLSAEIRKALENFDG